MAEPFYITTAISYPNGRPHIGHAYEAIATDVIARFQRMRGRDVFFLTGTDEHGEPVAQQAEAEGVTPRELGDRLAPRFEEMAAKINASNDFFIRTTDQGHMNRVQEIVQRVYDNGHVYEGLYEGWYCPRCAAPASATDRSHRAIASASATPRRPLASVAIRAGARARKAS